MDMDDDDEGWYNNNDDDDWWNDDDDYAWDIDLPDVIITADDDDSWDESDDDWWRTDYGDDDDDWWDDDDVGSWTNTDEKNYINAPDYWKNQTWHIPAYNEYLLNWKKWENYPEHWQPQTGQNCVSVALEYIANCLDRKYPGNDYVMYRESFELVYSQACDRNLFEYGVAPSHLSSFYAICGFEVESITSKDVQSCILNDTPVIGIIDSGNNMAHELFIIGYFADTDMYQTLNPATGTFQAFNKNDFCSFQPSIVLSQMRSCSQSGKSFFCRRHTHGHILSFICTFASWTYPICIYGVIVICDKFCSTL